MVKSCLVATCKNTLGKAGITFHKIGKKRYANRLKAIGRSADECLSPQNVICSKHYAEDDFIHFNGKKYLRLEAMPRFFIPRRPVIEQTTSTMPCSTSEIADKPNNSTNRNTLNILTADDIWLMYTDIFIITTQEDNIDTIMNEENLLRYPTNEFLTLMSEGCESPEFDISLELLES